MKGCYYNCSLRSRIGECELVLSASGNGQAMSCYEHNNNPSASIKQQQSGPREGQRSTELLGMTSR
jgi:hypothetical protein